MQIHGLFFKEVVGGLLRLLRGRRVFDGDVFARESVERTGGGGKRRDRGRGSGRGEVGFGLAADGRGDGVLVCHNYYQIRCDMQ